MVPTQNNEEQPADEGDSASDEEGKTQIHKNYGL